MTGVAEVFRNFSLEEEVDDMYERKDRAIFEVLDDIRRENERHYEETMRQLGNPALIDTVDY